MLRTLVLIVFGLGAASLCGAVTVSDPYPGLTVVEDRFVAPPVPPHTMRVPPVRGQVAAVTAGVHEDVLPTPPLSLVLAIAALGGIVLLGRRTRSSPWN